MRFASRNGTKAMLSMKKKSKLDQLKSKKNSNAKVKASSPGLGERKKACLRGKVYRGNHLDDLEQSLDSLTSFGVKKEDTQEMEYSPKLSP
jgi:hypothetical protein